MGRIGGIEKLKEFDELAAAMAILDQGMNLASEQIDAGQQANRTVTLVFVIAPEGRMGAGLGRQIRRRRGNGLDTGLLVIGDDRHRVAWLLLGCCRGLLNDLHLSVNAQNLRHLLLEFGIAAFQVVADLVWLHFLLVEDLAHRTVHQLAETGVPFRRSMLAGMASQQPRGPQFVRIAQLFRLAAGQRHQPGLGLSGDCRLLARSRAIIESRHWTISQRPLNAALHRLMMHPQSATHREERWVFSAGQQNPRPLDPARRLRSRLRYRNQPRQILSSNRQLNRLPPCCHDLRPPASNQKSGYKP